MYANVTTTFAIAAVMLVLALLLGFLALGLLPLTVVITLTGQEPGNEHTSTPQRVRRKLRKERKHAQGR